MRQTTLHLIAMAALVSLVSIGAAAAQTVEQVRRIVADGSAMLVDSRSRAEYAAGHIPGARVLNGPESAHVAELEHLVGGDKSRALVLYCDGPYCGQSKRLAEQLVAAGFTNVRRYQLGIPIWRALGGPTEIELEGIVRILNVDLTALFIDARSVEEFEKGTIPTTRSLPVEEVNDAINKRIDPLPRDDFNRRIVLFGRDAAQARAIADLLAKRPWQNVSYFSGSFETLAAALKNK